MELANCFIIKNTLNYLNIQLTVEISIKLIKTLNTRIISIENVLC